MNKNLLVVLGMMVAIGLISAVLTYVRAEKLAPPADLAAKGLDSVRKSTVIFYALFMPILVGPLAYFVYRGMLARSPDGASTSYLLLAVGIAVVFTILAAVVFKMRGFIELTALHVLYVAGFGWLVPMLWVR